MSRRWCIFLVCILALAPSVESDEPADPPEFKLVVNFYGVDPATPLGQGEIVARRGRIYQFTSESNEFIVIDRAGGYAELIDLGRKVQARVPLDKVNQAIASQRRRELDVVIALEKREDRASRVTARKTRELLEPHLKVAFDAPKGQMRLTNGSVEVDAKGVADADGPRLTIIAEALETFAKLSATRDPNSLPPAARLETITNLIRDKKLRPSEMSFVYRLNGPPEKYRWTYRYEAKLSDRDYIGLARLDRFRDSTKMVPLAEYEKSAQPLR